jgi:hypothetical protein
MYHELRENLRRLQGDDTPLPIVERPASLAPDGIGLPSPKRRGRPADADSKADRRLCEDWKAAKRQGMSRDAFARERGITVQELIDAQHREKYRRRRDAE